MLIASTFWCCCLLWVWWLSPVFSCFIISCATCLPLPQNSVIHQQAFNIQLSTSPQQSITTPCLSSFNTSFCDHFLYLVQHLTNIKMSQAYIGIFTINNKVRLKREQAYPKRTTRVEHEKWGWTKLSLNHCSLYYSRSQHQRERGYSILYSA